MSEHDLKCWPEYFEPLLSGEKSTAAPEVSDGAD
jgi:hypothetical protein